MRKLELNSEENIVNLIHHPSYDIKNKWFSLEAKHNLLNFNIINGFQFRNKE